MVLNCLQGLHCHLRWITALSLDTESISEIVAPIRHVDIQHFIIYSSYGSNIRHGTIGGCSSNCSKKTYDQ